MLLQETADNLFCHVRNRLANGFFPPLDEVTEAGLEQSPELVFNFFEMLVNTYSPTGDSDEPNIDYQANFCLFTDCLLRLRIAAEKKRVWAWEITQELQERIVEEIFVPEHGQRLQQDLLDAIREAGLEISPELKDAHFQLMEYYSRFWNKGEILDFDQVIKEMEAEGLNSIYDMAGLFMMQLEMVPDPSDQLRIVEMVAAAPQAKARDMVALMMLHADPDIRRSVPPLLAGLAGQGLVSSDTLWRMITIRNWLPEEERAALDRAISTCRKARVDIAHKDPGRIDTIYASGMDGSGAQALWVVVQSGATWLVCHVLFKLEFGIREIWAREVDDNIALNELTGLVEQDEVILLPVDEHYLEQSLAHFIAESNDEGLVPPPDILRLMEYLGKAHLSAGLLDIESVLGDDELEPGLDAEKIIETSDEWAMEGGFGQSWFEDDEDVDRLLEDGPFGLEDTLAQPEHAESMVLGHILEPRREQWIRCFLITALWLKCNSNGPREQWQWFIVLARAMRDGRPLAEIPLMVAIAAQTLYAAILRFGEVPFDQDLF